MAENNMKYNNRLEKELKKYKKLYELKIEQNFCQKQLAELKEKLQISRDKWDDLTRQDLNHEMDCLLEYLSVEEQKEKTLKYEIEEKVLSEQIKLQKYRINLVDKEIKNIDKDNSVSEYFQ